MNEFNENGSTNTNGTTATAMHQLEMKILRTI